MLHLKFEIIKFLDWTKGLTASGVQPTDEELVDKYLSLNGSVTKLFEKAKKNGWDNSVSDSVSNGNEGNGKETPC